MRLRSQCLTELRLTPNPELEVEMKRSIYLRTSAFCILSLLSIAIGVDAQRVNSIVVLHQGYYAFPSTRKQVRVITSQQEYAAALGAYTSEAPQSLDFSVGQVLLVDMGPRPSGGFSLQTIWLNERIKGAVRIAVEFSKPGNNCVTAAVITNPYQFVYVPTKREILVTESLNIFDCSLPFVETDSGT